jgi:bidirectional [NiFe] hydrogenase diaphorase subunit
VKGSAGVLAAVEEVTGLRAGETSADGQLSLSTTRCIGTCGLAPVVVADGAVVGHATPDNVASRVKGWLTRGTH